MDFKQQFLNIKEKLIDSIKIIFPISGKIHTVRLKNIWIEDKLGNNNYTNEKKIKLAERTLSIPIYADIELIDNGNNKVIDRERKFKLAFLPKMTSRGSFIITGNEYQVQNMLRLKPGVYTSIREDGELMSWVNLAKGRNFKIRLDPKSGIFFIQFGTSNIKLYHLLSGLGVSDNNIKNIWGEELLNKNRMGTVSDEIVKAHKALFKELPHDTAEGIANITNYFNGTVISKETTKNTLGKSFDKVTTTLLLETSRKILSISRGKEKTDDRDALEFKTLHSSDDLMAERIDKNARLIKNSIMRNIDRRNEIKKIISIGVFGTPIETFFTGSDEFSGLASVTSQTNPVSMLGESNKISLMGPGGITSTQAVTMDARSVHPSSFGFIDGIHTPECFDSETEVFTDKGWKFWKDLCENDMLATLINNRFEFSYPNRIISEKYEGEMFGVLSPNIDYLVTPNHRIYCSDYPSKQFEYSFVDAVSVHNKAKKFRCGGHKPYNGKYKTNFLKHNGINTDISLIDVSKLLCWYLVSGINKSSKGLFISYNNKDNHKSRISFVSPKLGFDVIDEGFYINNSDIMSYINSLDIDGGIPDEFMHYNYRIRLSLLDGLVDASFDNDISGKQKSFISENIILAKDVERLAISLGYSVTLFELENYKDTNKSKYVVLFNEENEKCTTGDDCHDGFYTQKYSGMIYCATVPGGLLYVKRGNGRGHWSGNSSKIGTTIHLSSATKKDKNNIKTSVIDIKTGKHTWLTPIEASAVVISFRDQFNENLKPISRKVKAVAHGEIKEVLSSDVKYVFTSAKGLFDISSNMIPFLHNDQGNRAMMAAKMIEQALPLTNREVPNVQSSIKGDYTFEKLIGKGFSKLSPVSGTVTKVTADTITIKDSNGKNNKAYLYNKFPLNTHVYLDSHPIVSVGDKVKEKQLIADTNYTKDGKLAIGVNLKAAYMPYKGYNFEDGIVISESASQKLSSMHMEHESLSLDENMVMNINKFKSYYPEEISPDNLSKLDSDGVIKVGSKVNYGEILIAGLSKSQTSINSEALKKLHNSLIKPYKKSTVEWHNDDQGIISDVTKTSKKITVYIMTNERAKIGDKISSRHAAKGTITKIISDSEMPRSADGNHLDIILNPLGIPSRINAGQIYENAAGKLSSLTGKPFIVDNFSNKDYLKEIKTGLKKFGISDKENIFDPQLNKIIPNIMVGNQYIMKLDHSTRKKFSARSRGGYTANMRPGRGGGEGGQKIGKMEYASLLSHDAKANIWDIANIKSESNDEMWRAIQMGKTLPAPKLSFAVQKLEAMLRGAGIDINKDGSTLQLSPLIDKQILAESNGEIKNPVFIKAKNLEPEKNGLFDPVLSGGIEGKQWNHVKLSEPTPNPIFELPIRELLDLTGTEYREFIDGKKWINKDGEEVNHNYRGAMTGGKALRHLLSKIDVDKTIKELKQKAKKTKGSNLNKMNKKIRYLMGLKKNKLSPTDYILTMFPIIPPKFRPIHPLPNGSLSISEVNDLYKDTMLVNSQLSDSSIPEDLKDNLRRDLYDGLKGISGLGSSITGRKRKGFLEQISGDQPKVGFFQSEVMGRRQDYTGRSTIIPEPSLGLDEVAIPKDMAWKIYESFIIRELIKLGYSPLAAKDHIKNKDSIAERALDLAMKNRPAILNRAPSLHKFSLMSFIPKLKNGKAIAINPLIVSGFGADFDGDTMSVHIPVSEKARIESFKLLPSENLLSVRNSSLMNLPSQESILGLYLMTTGGKHTNKRYRDLSTAVNAYKKREIQLNDYATIAGKKMTIGQALINSVLPLKYRDYKIIANKKGLSAILINLAKDEPKLYGNIVSKLKDFGNDYSYERGFSIGLDDLTMDQTKRNKLFAEADKKAKKIGIENAYADATKKLNSWLNKALDKDNNSFYKMMVSGAKGNSGQVRQIVSAPVLVKDVNDNVIPIPIKKSYGEGLPVSDYLTTLAGARKGMVDRALMTALPGAFSKEIISATINERITMKDCNTLNGIKMSIDDHNVLDRFLAKSVGYVAKRNDLVTSALLDKLRGKVKELIVRSPLTCEAHNGLCQLCYGLDEHGKLPAIERNVGALSAQTMSEPLTQMTMKTFHTGSVAGERGGVGGFQRIKEILEMHENVISKATLAENGGKVSNLKAGDAGGWTLDINGKKHYIEPGRSPLVKNSSIVNKGDAISNGTIKPQELLRLKGMAETQNYLVNELNNEFKNSGIDVKKKIFETAVRPLTNIGKILDPKSSKFIAGDFVSLNSINKYNSSKDKDNKIEYEPKLRGVNTHTLISKDWLERLNYRQLQKTLTTGAAEGWKSDIKNSPVGSYAYGIFVNNKEKTAMQDIVYKDAIEPFRLLAKANQERDKQAGISAAATAVANATKASNKALKAGFNKSNLLKRKVSSLLRKRNPTTPYGM